MAGFETLPTPLISPVEDVDVHRAVSLTKSGAVLLDVREDAEWAAGHVPGALHIPLAELLDADLSVLAGREVLVICRSGHRSRIAAAELNSRGLRSASVLNGMNAWAVAGLPVVIEAAMTRQPT